MPFFKESKEMYSIYQALFDRLASHPEVGPALASSNIIIRFKVQEPEGLVTINCREKPAEKGKYISYTLGESTLEPDLTILSTSDFCHKFWLGKVDIVSALLSGKAKATGNFSKAMKLMPVLKAVFNLYLQTLKDIGREDLIIE